MIVNISVLIRSTQSGQSQRTKTEKRLPERRQLGVMIYSVKGFSFARRRVPWRLVHSHMDILHSFELCLKVIKMVVWGAEMTQVVKVLPVKLTD